MVLNAPPRSTQPRLLIRTSSIINRDAWRKAPLCLSRRHRSEVRNVSLLVAIAVNNEGSEILGICEGPRRTRRAGAGFLKHLKERGLHGGKLIIPDACTRRPGTKTWR